MLGKAADRRAPSAERIHLFVWLTFWLVLVWLVLVALD
jgi:hypothetical protein